MPAPSQAGEPQVSTELEDMPDIGLDWPDLTAPEPTVGNQAADAGVATTTAPEQERAKESAPSLVTGRVAPPVLDPAEARARDAEALAGIDPGAELPYIVSFTGADEAIDQIFEDRFDLLSELRKGEKKSANLGQINRRGRADADLVDQLMRTRGYYDARVTFRMMLERPQPPLVGARLQVVPGNRYLLTQVDLNGLSASNAREKALRDLFEIAPGTPADTDLILGAVGRLRTGLAEGGYPFAKVSEPELRVDHDDRDAQLVVNVATGGFRNFGRIIVEGDPPFGAEHIAEFARFEPGEPFNQADVVDLNSAIIATGLAGSLTITPKEGASDDTVDLIIAMSKAPPRTVAGLLGYGTGEGARAEVSWQHRNFFPPEGAMTLRAVVGTNEQSASAIFRRNNFHKRDRALNLEVTAANLNQNAYEARTFGVAASLERQTNLIFQKKWTWSLGSELRISDERRLYGTDPVPRRLLYVIGAVPVSLGYDGSDDLLNPSEGFRLSGRASPELSLQGNVFGYVRLQVDGSAYMPMNDRLVLAGRVRLGTIVGAGRDRIAPTRRFYAGGGGSVRGYAYQAIGPRDINNDPLGGRSLTEMAVEARFRFGSENQFGIVPFLDAGTISTNPLPSASDLRVGAGIGVRYYSNFGPIRIDVGTPINRQSGDSRIGVYVSLGQAF
ncbi:autotransporter assembly complex protein TamA [Sphingobium sp. CR28]|uniref:autotransporter assembly complex protein TamA n=1 Tax=Sphingobium sp. CR28 TaxID=3400272 RepID=UPI003FED98B8